MSREVARSCEGPSARGRPRYASLDLWRGVACLAVVVFHSTTQSTVWNHQIKIGSFTLFDYAVVDSVSVGLSAAAWGWVGVPVFFVISGYCISATADASSSRGLPARRYFLRRLRRIYPPYWILLAILVPLILLLERPLPGLFTAGRNAFPAPAALSWSQWLGNITLTETWRWQLGGSGLKFFLAPAWTLCYEEQFYVVMGMLMLLGRRGMFVGAGVICVASLLIVRASIGKEWTLWGFFFDGHWLAFAAGILVFQQVNYSQGLRSRWPMLLLLLGLAYYVRALGEQRFMIAPNNLYQALVAAFAFALLLLFLHPWDARLARTPVLRPLMLCGRMCYSLYLVHWPVCKAVSHLTYEAAGWQTDWQILWLNVPLCLACCLPVGAAFFWLVERRFLNAPLDRPARAAV